MLGKWTFLMGSSYLLYLAMQSLRDMRAHRATKEMEPDSNGNYDMDGVSYDPHSHTVAVMGDHRIPDPVAETEITREVVALQVPQEPKPHGVVA